MKKITRLLLFLAATVAWGNVAKAQNTECAGTSTVSTQADPFVNGYNYSFTTSGTDVTVTFELLDTKVGLVAYAWTNNPGFVETQLVQGAGQSFSKTFTGQTIGATFSVACKFAYAGGMAVTQTFLYTVGNTCVAGPPDTEIPAAFTATVGAVTSSTVELLLNATDNSGAVTYQITYGTTTLTTSSNSGVQKSYIVSGLTPATAYSFSVSAHDAAGNQAANNPVVVPATTAAAVGPQVSAPAPPAYAAPKVSSVFSEAFANIAGTDFNPNWGQSGSNTVIQVAGNNTLKMANLNYQGIQFGSAINALPMTHLHLDVFTTDETSLQVFCISASTGEKFYQLAPLNLNAWNSYDIPLTAFTSQGLGVSDLIQFKFVGSGGKTSYLDNLYFYNSDPTPDTQAPTAFTATAGLIASDAVTLMLTGTDNSGAVNYEITYGTTTLNTSGISGVQKSFQVTSLTGSTDYSFSVVCKDATGNLAANSPLVVAATTLSALPGAPVPTFDPTKVISIFSNTYTSAAPAVNYNPNWGQSTVQSIVQLNGNDAIKYANLGYQGVDLMTTINAGSMNKLHLDVYPIDETALQITPISPGPSEKLFTLTPLNLNAWNSFDIPLTTFTGVDMANVFQFKFVGAGGKTSYIDNLYFFNDASTGFTAVASDKGIACFPNPVVNNLIVSAKTEINQVIVRNLLGQSMKTVMMTGLTNTIDLSEIASGNYFITIKLANGQLSTQKIVKL